MHITRSKRRFLPVLEMFEMTIPSSAQSINDVPCFCRPFSVSSSILAAACMIFSLALRLSWKGHSIQNLSDIPTNRSARASS